MPTFLDIAQLVAKNLRTVALAAGIVSMLLFWFYYLLHCLTGFDGSPSQMLIDAMTYLGLGGFTDPVEQYRQWLIDGAPVSADLPRVLRAAQDLTLTFALLAVITTRRRHSLILSLWCIAYTWQLFRLEWAENRAVLPWTLILNAALPLIAAAAIAVLAVTLRRATGNERLLNPLTWWLSEKAETHTYGFMTALVLPAAALAAMILRVLHGTSERTSRQGEPS